ncbi:MAG: SPOR domain-containing protein [Mariniphaga sp.]
MDITFYLIELLRLHDCVIVPDLGGFVTNYRPAEMDLASNSFNPPVKEIIFTGKLNKNDGLLVNYISEIEGVGYMEARQIISEFVDEIWSKLENGEKIEFQDIGSLHFDRNEKLIFEPAVHENLLLEAYGMEGFQFPQLEWKEITPSKRIFADKESARPRVRSARVKAFAIGIPILLALVMVPVSKYSWKNQSFPMMQTSNTASLPINDSMVPKSNFKIEADTVSKLIERKEESTVSAVLTVPATQTEPLVIKSNGRYRVIGGCFKLRENADKFLARLQTEGYKSELKIMPNESFLVIVQSYSDKIQAITALKALRQSDPKAGYWMSAN